MSLRQGIFYFEHFFLLFLLRNFGPGFLFDPHLYIAAQVFLDDTIWVDDIQLDQPVLGFSIITGLKGDFGIVYE